MAGLVDRVGRDDGGPQRLGLFLTQHREVRQPIVAAGGQARARQPGAQPQHVERPPHAVADGLPSARVLAAQCGGEPRGLHHE